jgi:hypothetical protein
VAGQVVALEGGLVIRIQEILDLEIHHLQVQARATMAEQEFRVEMQVVVVAPAV